MDPENLMQQLFSSFLFSETSWDESSWVQRPAELEAKKPEEKQRPVLKHNCLYTNLPVLMFSAAFFFKILFQV